jgi:hypothetical protein
LRNERDSLAATVIEKTPYLKASQSHYQIKGLLQLPTEILPQLETGSYLVYFESDSDIKNTKAFAYETITV